MRNFKLAGLLSLVFLSLSTLACRFTLELPWDVNVPDVQISPEDVSSAATRAAAVAEQAGQLAATAVLQGDNIVSTAVAGEALPAVGSSSAAGGSLQQKLTSIKPDADGRLTVTITNSDLAEYMTVQGGAFSGEGARIENVQIDLTMQDVVIQGDLIEPLAVPLTAHLRPVVNNGALQFQVIEAAAGVLPVPASLLSVLESGVNIGLGQAMNSLPPGVTLLDVALGDGSLTLLGQMD